MKIPTDLQLLNYIYLKYYDEYVSFSREDGIRVTQNYVPIDCESIAHKFSVDPNLIFGRLYYHLNKVYGYKNDEGNRVEFFAFKIGEDMHCINFPFLTSVLAGMRSENKRYTLTTIVAVLALVISVFTSGFSIYEKLSVKPDPLINEGTGQQSTKAQIEK